jgi:hypothetical protein
MKRTILVRENKNRQNSTLDKPIKKHMKAELSALEVQIENRFYSEDNLSKLCAEGAASNL